MCRGRERLTVHNPRIEKALASHLIDPEHLAETRRFGKRLHTRAHFQAFALCGAVAGKYRGFTMGRKGRKAKQGKRTDSGRLKRDNYPAPVYDRGSDWVQAQRARFDEHYSTAIGRAYASGLLGSGAESKDRYDAGKKLARIRSRYFAHRQTRCALDTSPRGNVVVVIGEDELEQALADKQWLREAEAAIDPGCAPWLDQLLSVIHTDAGPYWLTNLIEAAPGKRDGRDMMILQAALKALDAIVPNRPVGVIRAIRA